MKFSMNKNIVIVILRYVKMIVGQFWPAFHITLKVICLSILEIQCLYNFIV